MDNSSDNKHDVTLERPTSADSAQGPETSRRRFARNAMVGGAVFMSLANRAAWGQDYVDPVCVSTPSYLSLNPAINPLLSFSPGDDNAPPSKVQTYYDVQYVSSKSNDFVDGNQEVCTLVPADEAASDVGSQIGSKETTFRNFIQDNKNNW